MAAEAEGAGHDEDELAYLRRERDYRNLLLLEQPNGDFALTIARQFLYSAFVDVWWRETTRSTEPRLAAIAAKAEKESAYHVRHSAEWLIRLGDGTEESHRRAAGGGGFTVAVHGRDVRARGRGAGRCRHVRRPAGAARGWNAQVDEVLALATLERPRDRWMQTGGRAGRHSEHLGHLLSELQYLQRAYPGATW